MVTIHKRGHRQPASTSNDREGFVFLNEQHYDDAQQQNIGELPYWFSDSTRELSMQC